jgi:hypothetical protein
MLLPSRRRSHPKPRVEGRAPSDAKEPSSDVNQHRCRQKTPCGMLDLLLASGAEPRDVCREIQAHGRT